jgi:hypothetical protein
LYEKIKELDEEQFAKAKASGTRVVSLNSSPLTKKKNLLQSELDKVDGQIEVIKLDYKKKVMPTLKAQEK